MTLIRSQTTSRPRLIHIPVTGSLPAEIIGILVLFNPASRFVGRRSSMDSYGDNFQAAWHLREPG